MTREDGGSLNRKERSNKLKWQMQSFEENRKEVTSENYRKMKGVWSECRGVAATSQHQINKSYNSVKQEVLQTIPLDTVDRCVTTSLIAFCEDLWTIEDETNSL